jgi:hypothetical protein
MRRLKILHRTYYNFAGLVQLQPHRLLLRPREGPGLHIESFKLDIAPAAQLRWVRDAYDNSVAVATFGSPTSQLAIVSECVVRQFDETPLDFLVADSAVNYPFAYDAESAEILRPYLRSPPPGEQAALEAWVQRYWQPGEPVQTYGLLARLCAGISQSLTYQIREQPGVQSALETLTRGIGSCRDFANLFMLCQWLPEFAIRGWAQRLDSRLGGGLSAWCGLEGIRSNQRRNRRQPPHRRGGGALARCGLAGERCLSWASWRRTFRRRLGERAIGGA